MNLLAQDPNSLASHSIQKSINDLINCYHLNDFEKTIKFSFDLLSKNIEMPIIYSLLGLSLYHNGLKKDAIKVFETGISKNFNDAELFNNFAIVSQLLKDYKKAEELSKKAISINPNKSEFYFSYGISLYSNGKIDEAISAYKTSFKKNKDNHQALLELGNTLKDSKRFNQAIETYRKYQKVFSKRSEGFYCEGTLHIRSQRFKIGWKLYDKALIDKARIPVNGYFDEQKELWDGQKFNGKLLIYGEQGLGDQILYATVIPDLIEYHERIILKVSKKLKEFFRFNFPSIEVYSENENIPLSSYDKYISIGSLCKFFRKDLSDFKNSKFDTFKSSFQNKKLMNGFKSQKPKIGISWFTIAEKSGKTRSLKCEEISKLIKLKEFDFINLQYGEIDNQIQRIQSFTNNKLINIPNVDLTNDICAISEVICNCDLVITIDNTIAHLSSSLGKETWVLLPYSGDARWFEKINHSLWYKNSTLFRQSVSKNWDEILNKIEFRLTNYNLTG